MTKAKSTKRALLASVLSMVLCMAMLVGSTFAWFTDSVTSGKNKIVAGNLDVELYHTNGNVVDEQVGADTKLFVNADGSDILWEPGVMVYENFTVKNIGSLALKYRLTVNVGDFNTVADTEKSLKDVLKVAILDKAFEGDRTVAQALDFNKTVADFEKDGAIAAGAADNTYAIVIYWEPSVVDNDYNLNNGKESSDGEALYIDLGVNLFATQDTVESDSFGKDYDAKAWPYPETVATVEALQAAIVSTGNAQLAAPITWEPTANNISGNVLFDVEENSTVDVDFADNTLTINSADGRDGIKGANGATLTLSNGTIVANKSNGSSYPIVHANGGTVVLDGMNIALTATSGVAVSAGSSGGKLIIKDSTVTGPNTTYSNAVYVGSGATAEIENSTINGSLNVMNNGVLIIKSGTFTSNPTSYLAEGSTAAQNDDGTWTVVGLDEGNFEDPEF